MGAATPSGKAPIVRVGFRAPVGFVAPSPKKSPAATAAAGPDGAAADADAAGPAAADATDAADAAATSGGEVGPGKGGSRSGAKRGGLGGVAKQGNFMASFKLHKFTSLDAVTKQNENQNEMSDLLAAWDALHARWMTSCLAKLDVPAEVQATHAFAAKVRAR